MQRLRPYLSSLRPPWRIWRKRFTDCEALVELDQILLLPLLLVLLGWYIAAPSLVIAICLAMTLGLMGCGLFWALAMARGLKARRKLEYAAMQVGDELEESIEVRNRSWLPALWIEFVDRSDLPGYTVAGVRAVGGEGEQRWRAHTTCSRRGLYQLGPWELITGDPFGIFRVIQVYPQPQQILVYPPLAALPAEILPHRGAQGELRPLNQPIAAETADGMTVRSYVPGDPLHKIHWRTTARRAAPYVKIFEPEAASRIWLAPDMDADVQAGEGPDSTEETIILLAASLAARLLQDKLAVGLFSGGEPANLVLPQRGQAHLWALLERLAPLRARKGRKLETTMEQIRPLISARDLLVVITPSLDAGWTAALERLVQARGGLTAETIILDRASFLPGGEGGQAEAFVQALTGRGFQARLVRQGDIQPLSAAYGVLSRWEFSISATGRAIPRQSPRRAAEVMAGQGRFPEER